uniref:Secreted Chitin-binding peritrophin-like protein n=1 Tax=Pristhesancus plagipennis TaxID=1955184 RepID=A0A2K8JM35_PRIPG|nr:secreted Chitin-binding peritrophin-like protein [Pristhesancus plagipennis]
MASLLLVTLLALFETAFSARIHRVLASPDIPLTSFSCQDRPIGYYADVETNCQVYHMCGEGGRQYSYTCPNTTLFHQRMLICAHWYQVNCNRSMADYSANLLIGQRDKPFVEDYIASNLGDDLQDLELINNRNSKSLVFPNRSNNKIDSIKINLDLSSSSQDRTDSSDLERSPSASLASHSFNSQNRLTTLRSHGLNYKGAVAVKPTPVTEPTGTVKFRPTNVSFRSTIETPNSEAVLARTAPMTSAQPAHRTEPAFKHIDATTPRNQLVETPSRNLLPPLLSDIEQTNTIELRLEDPRRVLYIPKVKNGDTKVFEHTPEDKPIVVKINLRGQTGFRSSAVDTEKLTQCNRCHPAFVIDKKNCTPCLLIS